MNKCLDAKIDKAFDFVWNNLYYKGTKLIYDYITVEGEIITLLLIMKPKKLH